MPRLTLTFDNGPEPGVTDRVLDVLRERDVHATFFTVGNQLARPDARRLAERAAAEGHWIGNHTMTHSTPFGERSDPEYLDREIDGTQALVGELSHADRLFRPFGLGGILDDRLLSRAAVDHLSAGRYSVVLWNCVPRDWEDTRGWPDRVLEALDELDWAVVVVHDLATGAMDALPAFLDRLAADGVEVRQDLPDDCVPLRRGELVGAIDHLVA
jgi:peptidoglycan-N-acetylglucosamine deacetylase